MWATASVGLTSHQMFCAAWVMAPTAVRFGLIPPKERPGPWFPEGDTRKMTGWRTQITKKMPAGNVIYVGQNEGASRCARTKWASPFVLGHFGTPAECFTKYVVWFHAMWTAGTAR